MKLLSRRAALSGALAIGITVLGSIGTPDTPAASAVVGADDVRALLDLGRYPAADTAAAALISALDTTPIDSVRLAEALELQVETLVLGGKFHEPRALDAANRALAIRLAFPDPDSLGLARAWFAKATLLSARGQDSLPTALMTQVARIRERELGPEHPDVAAAFHELGRFKMYVSGLTADTLFRRAAAIRERALGRDDPDWRQTQMGLVVIAAIMGRPDTARYEQALEGLERVVGPDHPLLARHLISYGHALRNLSRHDHAHRVMERVVSIYRRTLEPRNVLTVRALRLTGVNHIWGARFERAIPYFREALDMAVALLGPDHLECAHEYMDLGDAYFRIGDIPAAEPLLEKSVEIWERELPSNHPLIALGVDHLAEFYLAIGRSAKARPHAERALAIRRQTLPPGALEIGWSAERMAQILHADTAQSFPFYREAARVFCTVFGTESVTRGRGLWIFASLAAWESKFDEAIALQQRANEIFEKRGVHLGWGERSMGLLKRSVGRMTEATAHFERARHAFEQQYGPTHTTTAMGWKELAFQLAGIGLRDSAFRCALRAEEIRRSQLQRNIRELPEPEALHLAFFSTRGAARDLLLSLVMQSVDAHAVGQAWDAVIHSRAMVLDEMAVRNRTLFAQSNPEVGALLARYDSLGRRQANLEIRTSDFGATHHALIERAAREREEVARRLAARSLSFRQQQQRSRIGLHDLKRAMPPRSALLAFVRFLEYRSASGASLVDLKAPLVYAAFVLRASADPILVTLGSAEEVDRLVDQWKREVSRAVIGADRRAAEVESAYRREIAPLRERIWDPLERYLEEVETVFVVPEGSLHLLSLATLPIGDSEYLVDRGPHVHYLSAERDLVPTEGASVRGRGLLAMGAPAFDVSPSELPALAMADRPAAGIYRGPRSACAGFQGLRFGALPHAATEIEDVARLWKSHAAQSGGASADEPLEVFRGPRASETEFKLSAPGKRAVHVATHGFFLGGECDSGRTTSRGIGGLVPASSAGTAGDPGERTPLLLSGVALAGANLRERAGPDEDDGILTAEEIAALDLSTVEWAVFSACETGVGAIGLGEGVLGLRRALQIAGVRTSIMSLWKVDDRAVRRWMRALYEARLENGLDVPSALRRACTTVLEERRHARVSTHPATWGAFIAVGSWR